MEKQVIILALTIIWLASCNKSHQDSIDSEKQDCSFKFKIEVKNANSYKYNSENGRLKKLIDPFQKNALYADTILFLTQTNICELMTFCKSKNVMNYPDNFNPKGEVGVEPEPSYTIQFTIDGKNKKINWTKNTKLFETKDAQALNEIILKINSIILTSPEFKALPEHHYKWL